MLLFNPQCLAQQPITTNYAVQIYKEILKNVVKTKKNARNLVKKENFIGIFKVANRYNVLSSFNP